MATMDITESGFQTPASKKRKASGSPSLPPVSQPTTPPSNYKNKTPLIATGIDPKFNTPIKIMSELRQYHPNLRVFQIKQTKNGWSTWSCYWLDQFLTLALDAWILSKFSTLYWICLLLVFLVLVGVELPLCL